MVLVAIGLETAFVLPPLEWVRGRRDRDRRAGMPVARTIEWAAWWFPLRTRERACIPLAVRRYPECGMGVSMGSMTTGREATSLPWYALAHCCTLPR